jgi:hypothetical protein
MSEIHTLRINNESISIGPGGIDTERCPITIYGYDSVIGTDTLQQDLINSISNFNNIEKVSQLKVPLIGMLWYKSKTLNLCTNYFDGTATWIPLATKNDIIPPIDISVTQPPISDGYFWYNPEKSTLTLKASTGYIEVLRIGKSAYVNEGNVIWPQVFSGVNSFENRIALHEVTTLKLNAPLQCGVDYEQYITGSKGQVLMSQGDTLPPTWSDIPSILTTKGEPGSILATLGDGSIGWTTLELPKTVVLLRPLQTLCDDGTVTATTPGNNGQVLMSQGAHKPPAWRNISPHDITYGDIGQVLTTVSDGSSTTAEWQTLIPPTDKSDVILMQRDGTLCWITLDVLAELLKLKLTKPKAVK